jgi:alpha-1,6-mannosyltransferase
LAFAVKIAGLDGIVAANFFLLFTAAQFHLQFYLSRTLPNFLAFPVVVAALAQLIATDIPSPNANTGRRRLRLGLGLLVMVGIIARSEVAILSGVIFLVDLLLSLSPVTYISTVLPSIILSIVVATAATISVDTHLWASLSFPELEAILFNVVEGHASDWGVQRWSYYLLSLPKLLLNPLLPVLTALTVLITLSTSLSVREGFRKLRYTVIAPSLYISGFSFLAHKEWRFIIYVIPLLTASSSVSAAYVYTQRKKSIVYRILNMVVTLSILVSLLLSVGMGLISSANYPGGSALETLHETCNATNARVYLDVPTRMTGATLPLCRREGWTYTKSENITVLNSPEYWQEIDYAIVGSLADVPCKKGKGIEGKHEWEVIHRQRGYAGITWHEPRIPSAILNNTYIDNVNAYVRHIRNSTYVQSMMPHYQKAIPYLQHARSHLDHMMWFDLLRTGWTNTVVCFERVKERVEKKGILKVPHIKLEEKVYILKHLRKEDFLEKTKSLEEQKEKERKGLGNQGEVEGQWRDFY